MSDSNVPTMEVSPTVADYGNITAIRFYPSGKGQGLMSAVVYCRHTPALSTPIVAEVYGDMVIGAWIPAVRGTGLTEKMLLSEHGIMELNDIWQMAGDSLPTS